MANTLDTLNSIAAHVRNDDGLRAQIADADIEGGALAAELMNDVIAEAIAATGVNADGRITANDARAISDYIRANPALYDAFVDGHGDDEGMIETGFHLVQGDGGTLEFQGRNFVNTIADAIYHIGFTYENGWFLNEDGDANEEVADVAGWLNYFVNGVNVVYGAGGNEELYSGRYSAPLAAAANEKFLAMGGDDSIWAGDGDDTVNAGRGNDVSGGGAGHDLIFGKGGNDTLWGEGGNDTLNGGNSDDVMGGGSGDDKLIGARGHDTLTGEQGRDTLRGDGGNGEIWAGDDNDRAFGGGGEDTIGGGSGHDILKCDDRNDSLYGDGGNDRLYGGNDDDGLYGSVGNDTLYGDAGADTLSGDMGEDVMVGGAGTDLIYGWEDTDAQDIFVFAPGDSGLAPQDQDTVEGFDSGEDLIDLTAFAGLSYIGTAAFSGTGAESRYSGDTLQIDADGDGNAEMAITFRWVPAIDAGDVLLA